jgi:hypothetical protein
MLLLQLIDLMRQMHCELSHRSDKLRPFFGGMPELRFEANLVADNCY